MTITGDYVLLKSREVQVKETRQPTQQELLLRTSQEAGFSSTVGLGQFFGTRPRCNAEGKWIVPACNEFTKPRPIEGAMMVNILLGQHNNWSRLTRGRLRGSMSHVPRDLRAMTIASGKYCTDTTEFELEIDGLDCVFVNGGTAFAPTQP